MFFSNLASQLGGFFFAWLQVRDNPNNCPICFTRQHRQLPGKQRKKFKTFIIFFVDMVGKVW